MRGRLLSREDCPSEARLNEGNGVMIYGLTLVLLMDPAIGLAPSQMAELNSPQQFQNYTEAYRAAQRTKKPLLVILNPGHESNVVPVHLDDVRKTEQRRKLLERYVVAEINASTPYGETIHKLFENKPLPHVAVIDREQKWQVFRTSRTLQGNDWTKILEALQNGDSSVTLNLDARPACPT